MITSQIIKADDGGNKNDFVSTERLYLTKDGKVVGEGDPAKNELLVNAGGRLPAEVARKYGLPREKKGGKAKIEPEPESATPADDAKPKPVKPNKEAKPEPKK